MKLPTIHTNIQVRYSDTDAMGHISNESYITFMQVGRLEFYEKLTELTGYQQASVVANITMDFLQESFYGDVIKVISWCSHVGTKSMKICSEIYANETLVANGVATNVAFDAKTRKSEPLPQGWEASDYTGSAKRA